MCKYATCSLTPLQTSVLCNLKDHSGRSCFLLYSSVVENHYILLRCKCIYVYYYIIYLDWYLCFGWNMYIQRERDRLRFSSPLEEGDVWKKSCHVHMEEPMHRQPGWEDGKGIEESSRFCLWHSEMDVSKNRGTPNGWFIMEHLIKMDD